MKDKSKELTRREVEVLKMIASGSSNKEIASTLSISERTVKNHVSNIFKRLMYLIERRRQCLQLKMILLS